MQARAFWTTVTADSSNLLDRLLRHLSGARFCVVGGQAVNAYVDPLVSLDLDLAIAAADLDRLLPALQDTFTVERFPHSVNLSAPGSDLRIQFQTDSRYEQFVPHASIRPVLGVDLPVARIEDVLQGKVWAAQDDRRRPSKRQKDLADIARILETFPQLRPIVPDEILKRLL